MNLGDFMQNRRGILIGVAALLLVTGGVVFATRGPGAAPEAQSNKYGGKVRRLSGDRLKLIDGRSLVLAGVRLPFPQEPEADNARRVLEKWVGREGLKLDFDETVEFKKGRQLAYVYANDTFINERMVRDGLAFVRLRKGNHKFADLLLKAQAAAQKEGKGVWKTIHPSGAGVFVGDPDGGAFHRASCGNLAKCDRPMKNLRGSQDAFSRGMSPCGTCKPLGG